MSVIDEILAWSTSPTLPWVRDALRRIVTQSELGDTDVAELTELCKKAHGLSSTTGVAIPLDTSHLQAGAGGGPVTIAALTHVSDVNALAPNETIRFERAGLTIVYGDNGAGKSGYSRILKRACRARGSSEAILANALSDQPAGTPTAKLTVAVADVETEHTWKDGTPGPTDLSAVSVFDSSAAQVYVSDKTEVRFRPLGLDVLDKVAGVCVRVKGRLEGEKRWLEAQSVVWPEVPRDTEAGRLLGNLTALTPRDQVDRLGILSDAERQELATLKDVLATARLEDPAKKANELRAKAARIRRLLQELENLAKLLGAESLKTLAKLRDETQEAGKLVDQAARAFDGETLAGLGTPTWREMWDAARAYSEGAAYPSHAFPHVDDEAHCVLCQQSLDGTAKVRLTKLEEFFRGHAQTALQTKKKALADTRKACLSIVPGELTADALEDLSALDTSALELVQGFLIEAKECRAKLDDAQLPTPVSRMPPVKELEALATGLDTRATEMARAADPAARLQAQQKHDELHARDILSGLRTKIHSEIDRKARINAYERCAKDTDTRAMTKVSADLTKKHVTDALTTAFSKELTKLGFTALELELRPVSAQKGVLFHQVQLKHATRAQLPKVVSEGEGRCIALAAFLAEVGSAPDASAIVFDDPVSSLDHIWRSSVARRLAEEAGARQVIVFTHELVFLSALLQEAEDRGVPCAALTVSRGSDSLAGHIEPELPWNGLSVHKRIGVVKKEWQEAEKIFRLNGQKAYEPSATGIYARLRKTWERALEEVLFNKVVLRFRESVETKRLKAVGDITASDLEAVEAGMTKCSKWEGGHDQAMAVNEHVPPPVELKADIDALDGWIAAVETRRQKRRS